MTIPPFKIAPLARAVSRAAVPRLRDAVLGPPERARLETVCQQTLRDVIQSFEDCGASREDLGQVLEVLERTFEDDGLAVDQGPGAASWSAAARAAGFEPESLALPVDEVMRAFYRRLPDRLADEAASPGSPLYRLVSLHLFGEISARLSPEQTRGASDLPIEAEVARRLDAMQSMCSATDQPFLTPHLLLPLLEDPECVRRVDAVVPNLAGRLRARLARFVQGTRQSERHFGGGGWIERDEVRQARAEALLNGERTVAAVRLLYAALCGTGGTVGELRVLLGIDFFWLLDVLALPVSTSVPARTPGPVLEGL